jgi:peptide/nickel transport system permease protein
MTTAAASLVVIPAQATPRARRTRLRVSPAALAASLILLIWIVTAIAAPVLAPHDPQEQALLTRLTPPVWQEDGNPQFPVGTDELGRDILSRLIYGSRASLLVGMTVVGVAASLGSVLGLLSGFYGGLVDTAIMRTVDLFLAFPFFIMALALMSVLGPSFLNVVLVLGLTGWVPFARMVRAETLGLRRRDFVQASLALGARDSELIVRHLVPHLLTPIVVLGTLEIATAIVAEAGLTFLGLGIPPSTVTWGNMLAAGREYVFTTWWLTTMPGVTIFVAVLSINLLGDWLRDVWDPRLRRMA